MGKSKKLASAMRGRMALPAAAGEPALSVDKLAVVDADKETCGKVDDLISAIACLACFGLALLAALMAAFRALRGKAA